MTSRLGRTAALVAALVLAGGCGNGGNRPGGAASPSSNGPAGASPTAAAAGAQNLPVTQVGMAPQFAVQDAATKTLYVTNSGSNTVSVISMAECNAHHVAACARQWPYIAVGSTPLGLAVDLRTDTIYVANAGDGTISVIAGATCNAGNDSGCGHKPPTVRVGAFADAVSVDPVTDAVFVTNQDAKPGTVSVIDGNTCTGSHPAGCIGQPFATVRVGAGPSGIDINSVTNTVYVANTAEDSNNHPLTGGDTLSVINGSTCRPGNSLGCRQLATVRVGADPAYVTAVSATNTLYVANTYDNTNSATGTVSVVNGATCDAETQSGCRTQAPPQVPAAADPVATAYDPATNTVYVANENAGTLSIINAATCNAIRISGCSSVPPDVSVGTHPAWAVVSTAFDTIYVVDGGANVVVLLTAGPEGG